MTSYERSYVSWYVKSNRKRLLVGFGILLVIMILPIFMVQRNPAQPEVMELPLVLQVWIVSIVCGMLSIAMPVIQFRYLMKKRSCDLYLPLPIKRNRFFVLQFIIGLCYLIVPVLFFFMIAACEKNSWDYVSIYAIYFLGVMIFLFALYSIITFLVIHCNSFWDAVCVALGFSFVSLLLYLTVNELLNTVVMKSSIGAYHAHEFFPMELIGCVMSPIVASGYFLTGLMEAFYDYQYERVTSIWEAWQSGEVAWLATFLFWGIICIFACWLAYRTYLKRSGEQSEQRTTAKVVYPLLIFLITISLMFQNLFDLGMLWITVVVFLALNFIAERKIIVHKYMVVSFVVMAVLTGAITYTLIETKVFHTIYEVPDREQIVSVNIRLGFNDSESAIKYDGKFIQYFVSKQIKKDSVISEVYALHKKFTDSFTNDITEPQCSINIYYEMSDGTYVNRDYPLPYEAYKEDVDELVEQLYEDHAVDEIATSYFLIESPSE